jgi:hypothetical protein
MVLATLLNYRYRQQMLVYLELEKQKQNLFNGDHNNEKRTHGIFQ